MLKIKLTNSAANVEIELEFMWILRYAIEIIFPSTGTETTAKNLTQYTNLHLGLKSYSPVRGRKQKFISESLDLLDEAY